MKRSAIVTGAAGGIGKSIAEALSQEGYDVIVADKDEINGLSVSEAIGGVFIRVDLTNRESCRHLIEAAVEELGGIDILVNNAGFQYVKPLEDFPEDKWEEMLQVMLNCALLVNQICLAAHEEKKLGPGSEHRLHPWIGRLTKQGWLYIRQTWSPGIDPNSRA